MAIVGQQLLQPEAGWKRINDTDVNIEYIGNWTSVKSANYYGGTAHMTNTIGTSLIFEFKGTEIRVIAFGDSSRSNSVEIEIDGVKQIFSSRASSTTWTMLAYEKTSLSNSKHTVKITNMTSSFFNLEAIDINEDGQFGFNRKTLLQSNGKTYSLESIDTWYETKMTSNNAPAPLVASASGQANATFPPFKAFDGLTSPSTLNNAWASSSELKNWLMLDYGEVKSVSVFSLHVRTSAGAPKDFKIEGSNDKVTFKELGVFKGLPNWMDNETREFKLSKRGVFRYYRIISESFMNISELIYGYQELIVYQIPSHSAQDFIDYGMDSPIETDGVFNSKNYILQDTVSENAEGLWKTQLDRKPLSIGFN